jgi:hypothetical protein
MGTKVILQGVHRLGAVLLVDCWSQRWVTVPQFFLDLQLAKASDGGRIHCRDIGGSTDPIVMSDSAGSQLHVGFGALGNHDTSPWDRRIGPELICSHLGCCFVSLFGLRASLAVSDFVIVNCGFVVVVVAVAVSNLTFPQVSAGCHGHATVTECCDGFLCCLSMVQNGVSRDGVTQMLDSAHLQVMGDQPVLRVLSFIQLIGD